jgi:hypothetical protein
MQAWASRHKKSSAAFYAALLFLCRRAIRGFSTSLPFGQTRTAWLCCAAMLRSTAKRRYYPSRLRSFRSTAAKAAPRASRGNYSNYQHTSYTAHRYTAHRYTAHRYTATPHTATPLH